MKTFLNGSDFPVFLLKAIFLKIVKATKRTLLFTFNFATSVYGKIDQETVFTTFDQTFVRIFSKLFLKQDRA